MVVAAQSGTNTTNNLALKMFSFTHNRLKTRDYWNISLKYMTALPVYRTAIVRVLSESGRTMSNNLVLAVFCYFLISFANSIPFNYFLLMSFSRICIETYWTSTSTSVTSYICLVKVIIKMNVYAKEWTIKLLKIVFVKKKPIFINTLLKNFNSHDSHEEF